MIGVTYLDICPKWQLPKGIFLSGNFPNVQFPKRQLPQAYVKPSEAPLAAMGLGWARGPSVAARTDGVGGGPSATAKRLGKLTLGKLHI